ncbi:anti-repressor SinI family protein [Alkalihalobacillus trypoxylicola]|nr:anti-repressor SinI family protein [Alkalihalobacillus trypoxylicola]GAF64409.1 hypothetical protein BTS2_1302 [Bacillus sp. TS-2]
MADSYHKIDDEWYTLLLEAKQLGLSVEEIRDFIQANNAKE